jgi:hypothetical protein
MGYEETNLIKQENYKGIDETPISAGFFQQASREITEFENETWDLHSKDIRPLEESIGKKSASAKIDDIYFQPEFTSEVFQTAFKLLAEAEKYCRQAVELVRKNEMIGADDSIQHLQALLPELFCCRDLSKSLGSIVNAIQNALFNNKGLPLSEIKLIELQKIVVELRNKPFMRFNEAVDLIMEFEDAGFTVQPQGFEKLTELLDE